MAAPPPTNLSTPTELNSPVVSTSVSGASISTSSAAGASSITQSTSTSTSTTDTTLNLNNTLVINNNSAQIKGSLNVDNNITTTGSVYSYSDERLKINIKPIENALNRIEKLNGVYYQWKDYNKGDNYEIGLLAQNVQSEFPELVNMDFRGILTVDYTRITAILIECIKELKQQIIDLQK